MDMQYLRGTPVFIALMRHKVVLDGVISHTA